MRFMMLVGANAESEAAFPPDERTRAEVAKFNEEMMRAGVLRAADGLCPSSSGARVEFSSGWPSVTDGPFVDPKELIAGYWIIEVASKAEAIEWAMLAPFTEGRIEIRQAYELSDVAATEAIDHHTSVWEGMPGRTAAH